jgi:predicted DNA-binding transcriptional regulator AlpA
MTAQPKEHNEYMRSPEMARYLCIGKSMPPKWRFTGYGPPYIKAGKTVLYRRRDVDQWVASRLQRPTPDQAG